MSDSSPLILFNTIWIFYICIVPGNIVNEPHMSLCLSFFSETIYLHDPKYITDTVSAVSYY